MGAACIVFMIIYTVGTGCSDQPRRSNLIVRMANSNPFKSMIPVCVPEAKNPSGSY
jgi:hypothetical protein